MSQKVLSSSVPSRVSNLQLSISGAARATGTSPVRIAVDMLLRRLGRHGLEYSDYFKLALYRTNLTEAERLEYIGNREALALNVALQGKVGKGVSGLIDSKVLTNLLLRAAGLPVAETLAVYLAKELPLPWPRLRDAGQIHEFFSDPHRYPLFGKPVFGSRSIGAASFIGRDGDILTLGDGTKVSSRALSEEIARDYPDGYLFQSLLRPHRDIETLIGPLVGTLRIVTLIGDHGPEPLYSVLKMPGQGAMVDGGVSGRNGMALVDLPSGRLIRAQYTNKPCGTDAETNLITGARLPGAALPDWERAVKLAVDAHLLLSNIGLIGTDVILTDKGPVITELNSNPLASLYQQAANRGILNADFLPKYRKALAIQGVKLPLKGVRI